MKDKKISVITIVKNGMPFIKSTVKSFNLQNYSNKELIIIYSDSEDGTENYLKNLKQDNIIIEKAIENNTMLPMFPDLIDSMLMPRQEHSY